MCLMISLIIFLSVASVAFGDECPFKKSQSCPNSSCGKERFTHEFFKKYPRSDVIRLSNGKFTQLPFRCEGKAIIIHGSAELSQVKTDLHGEGYSPISVGGHAAVQLWIMDYSDSDTGIYKELILTISTAKEPISLPKRGDVSFMVQHPENTILSKRLYLDSIDPILAGREIWGFPKFPRPVSFSYATTENLHKFEISADGELVITGHVAKPPPNSFTRISNEAARAVTTREFYQTTERLPLEGNLFAREWDEDRDELVIGSDEWMTDILSRWDFEPRFINFFEELTFVATRPDSWLPANYSATV